MKGIYIFVLDRGFVLVGDAEISDRLAWHWHLKTSRTIRRWGTSHGLGELRDGPLPGTVLDTPVERQTPFRSVLDILVPTEKGAAAWRHVLST